MMGRHSIKARWQLLLLFAIWALPACLPQKGIQPRITHEAGWTPSVSQFMADAMYNGLATDDFPIDVLEELLASPKLFVPKCPICRPTEAGMADYLAVAKKSRKPSGTVDPDLQSPDGQVRKVAFMKLVARYVAQHHERLGLSASDDASMRKALVMARRQGMDYMPEGFGNFCPSCDGACGTPP
jgi:hypothetical protein